jgi:predicted neutral ceramidase superfamily lipid hydrolase
MYPPFIILLIKVINVRYKIKGYKVRRVYNVDTYTLLKVIVYSTIVAFILTLPFYILALIYYTDRDIIYIMLVSLIIIHYIIIAFIDKIVSYLLD